MTPARRSPGKSSIAAPTRRICRLSGRPNPRDRGQLQLLAGGHGSAIEDHATALPKGPLLIRDCLHLQVHHEHGTRHRLRPGPLPVQRLHRRQPSRGPAAAQGHRVRPVDTSCTGRSRAPACPASSRPWPEPEADRHVVRRGLRNRRQACLRTTIPLPTTNGTVTARHPATAAQRSAGRQQHPCGMPDHSRR